MSSVAIIGLSNGGAIPLDYTLRVDWKNTKSDPGDVAAICVGATVNPISHAVAATSNGTVYFNILHHAPATGVTISVTLTVNAIVIANDEVTNITVA